MRNCSEFKLLLLFGVSGVVDRGLKEARPSGKTDKTSSSALSDSLTENGQLMR